jgi:hypothetical protein
VKNGIVYIVFDLNKKADRFRELNHSIKSVRKMCPNLSITLFTDIYREVSGIDNIRVVDVDCERIKQKYLYTSFYDNTLYLDCDTEVVGPIDDLFKLMERFDIAATHDLIRKDPKKSKKYPDYSQITSAFPEHGGGVLLFKKSPVVENFFKVWQKNFKIWYDLTGEVRDQPSFRVSIWECMDLHFYALPQEYNIRTKKYSNIIPRIKHEHDMWRK